jgi:hypothetical protein
LLTRVRHTINDFREINNYKKILLQLYHLNINHSLSFLNITRWTPLSVQALRSDVIGYALCSDTNGGPLLKNCQCSTENMRSLRPGIFQNVTNMTITILLKNEETFTHDEVIALQAPSWNPDDFSFPKNRSRKKDLMYFFNKSTARRSIICPKSVSLEWINKKICVTSVKQPSFIEH